MREIKFRAWAKDTKQFEYCGLYDSHKLFVEHNLGSEYILMQYTGLKDKNGKEIWEGDIVENNDYKWKIDFYDGSFVMRQIGQETNKWLLMSENKHSEIIGNIYENPELLSGVVK